MVLLLLDCNLMKLLTGETHTVGDGEKNNTMANHYFLENRAVI